MLLEVTKKQNQVTVVNLCQLHKFVASRGFLEKGTSEQDVLCVVVIAQCRVQYRKYFPSLSYFVTY